VLTDARAAVMVDTTTSMARALGLSVTAEGVESTEVRDRLAAFGCDVAQGWLYSAAVPGAGLAEVLGGLHDGVDDSRSPAG
jgi:EAL domain-containing protein (putative c-di-GMP-specific phosphodiesterase class I)